MFVRWKYSYFGFERASGSKIKTVVLGPFSNFKNKVVRFVLRTNIQTSNEKEWLY
ncbi:Uncharacterised protein [Yersinia intermedia]|jgi:hypothetical protein|nr:Uncharacterised protein [Yersinia intermedia]CNB44639.1 Uncharacterised protein [Yersinia intermedia]CNF92592.1 Uncharacterised protein [Yersinia intermedia]CNH83661.1 Uncharacterised protein [Yersinia intermedia]CQJ53621.1 Uncharacterised protein [Yersinia intermedia]